VKSGLVGGAGVGKRPSTTNPAVGMSQNRLSSNLSARGAIGGLDRLEWKERFHTTRPVC